MSGSMKRRQRVLVRLMPALLAICAATPLAADEAKVTLGLRTHHVIVDASGEVLGRATVVPSWTEAWHPPSSCSKVSGATDSYLRT